MTQSTLEKTCLRLSALFLFGVASLWAGVAQAQVVRPSNSVYILLRSGVATYYGDIDRNPDDGPDESTFQPLSAFDDPGLSLGGEIGYLFSDNLSFGIGGLYHSGLPLATNDNEFEFTENLEGGEAYQLQALFRYMPFAGARFTPFVELGGAFVSGQGTENERNSGTADEDVFGYGPVVGLGFDLQLSPRLSLFLANQTTFVFPDVALDGADPGAFGVEGDNFDFDALNTLGGGLKLAFKAPFTAAEIESLQCPSELTTGQTGSFMVMVNDDATQPVTTTWQWGDGTTGSGMTTSHVYNAPGTYTVTAMTMNQGGEDSESCLVTVTEPPVPPTLAGCRATPSTVNAGEQVTIDATATDADRVSVDFGDGTTATALPARHAYAETGSYTVTITATNQYGTDTCTIPVTVGDTYCANITELNPVFFGYGSSSLTADARERLEENIEILRRCPEICVTINAYSDGVEGDAQRISQARADAVLAYYVAQGVRFRPPPRRGPWCRPGREPEGGRRAWRQPRPPCRLDPVVLRRVRLGHGHGHGR